MLRKHSHKRDAILAEIKNTVTHPTAVWVYERLKAKYPDLSLGTVYRNISMFKKDGLVRSVGVFDGEERFDGNVSSHPHLVCRQCGRVIDIKVTGVQLDLAAVAMMNGIEIASHDITFYGRCDQCRGGD